MLDVRSLHLRRLIVDALVGGDRGHIGSSMSLVEILRVLYDDAMRHDPANPHDPNRDRCILSKGHGCLALYAILADKGYFPTEWLSDFCRHTSPLGGHPSHKVPGVEAATGALGHGLSIGVGMALAARIQKRDSRVFVVLGDGEIQEGSVWEAAMHAAKHRLSNLVAIVDYNKIQSAGRVEDVCPLEPLAAKWQAFGWATREIDGHHLGKLEYAMKPPLMRDNPLCIIAHTTKGKGISFAENDPEWHHKNSVADIRERLYAELGGVDA